MTVEATLTDIGAGVGALFTGMGLPLMTLLIYLGIAVGVIGIFAAVASTIKNAV